MVQSKPAAAAAASTNMQQVSKLHLKSTTSLKDEKIPIVRHIIKDDDIEEVQGEQLEPLDLDRIIKLFVDPHSVRFNTHFQLTCLMNVSLIFYSFF
jgi:hypothetical protein